MNRLIVLVVASLLVLAGCTDQKVQDKAVKDLANHCLGDISIKMDLSAYGNTITVACNKMDKAYVAAPSDSH